MGHSKEKYTSFFAEKRKAKKKYWVRVICEGFVGRKEASWKAVSLRLDCDEKGECEQKVDGTSSTSKQGELCGQKRLKYYCVASESICEIKKAVKKRFLSAFQA